MSKTDFTWRTNLCGNPNKAWICDIDGLKLTRLMSVKLAQEICYNHNMIVGYLQACQKAN